MTIAPEFATLAAFVDKTPGCSHVGSDRDGDVWWLKMDIDIDDALAWNVVQEYGYVLNHVSLTEHLPTVFKPVSPPPYLNGGPKEYLSWVIECADPEFTPNLAAEWLEGRLPRPVENRSEWLTDDDD